MQEKRPLKRRIAVTIALSAVLAALTTVATALIAIPVPATGGYIDFGDIVIFVAALTFGPLIGGLAGGIGSAISDAILAPVFAPFTLIIKGFEGAISGAISNQKALWRDVVAVTAAGLEMVGGYFFAEYGPLHIGIAAVAEVPGNMIQFLVSAVIGVPLALVLRKRLPKNWLTKQEAAQTASA